MSTHDLPDPLTQFPRFAPERQTQEEPGLSARMDPEPDCGEDTYVGSGRLKGRRALVTGGDSGIGRAVALAYAREGADVVFTHLPEEAEDAARTTELLDAEGVRHAAREVDLRDEAATRALVRDAVEFLGGLDLIANVAGEQRYVDDLAELDPRQVRDTFEINVFALIWIVQEALPHLPAGAAIVNTASTQATTPLPGLVDYAGTKGAIVSITKALAQQLTPRGIRVNAVVPGAIWTPIQVSLGRAPEQVDVLGHDAPLGRPGQPAEMAPAYVFLASTEASYVSGEVLGATGGTLY
ncbi:SDR family oxidoreductase [Micrococcus sp. ACRRV]|uniref:SDR family oxidoreductase n=1 Tax=Micrococcus sp. ACRRV TaxID=2918203 RepID=UPI001EF29BBE|nr:SDR family oxidoreductase [Micrococcus sp. ACRRV]MCG7422103.1 SDR family oxidoreductase [Micrococcus sp. ACRRV]